MLELTLYVPPMLKRSKAEITACSGSWRSAGELESSSWAVGFKERWVLGLDLTRTLLKNKSPLEESISDLGKLRTVRLASPETVLQRGNIDGRGERSEGPGYIGNHIGERRPQ